MNMQVSAVTATGDTTKTSIGSITLPKYSKAIVGVWAYACAAATLTTGEQVSGIFELESDDLPITPFQLPLDIVGVLTSGAFSLKPTVWSVNIPNVGGAVVTGYMTMDVAQTGALKGRYGIISM